jgi:molybdopterin-guanine dinucleotide biosynthesis protein A
MIDDGVSSQIAFDAVVLAGGNGRRLGGVDKAGLVIGGLTLLDRVLLASAGAEQTVVVGEPRATIRTVGWTSEHPPEGGPVAGLAAGLEALAPVSAPLVLVLATDLTRIQGADIDRLIAAVTAAPAADAAVFTDDDGRLQPLAAIYRRSALSQALAAIEPVHGKAVTVMLRRLNVVTVPDRDAAQDCDTPDQLAAARQRYDGQP